MPRLDDYSFWREETRRENEDGLPHRPETYDEYIKRFSRALRAERAVAAQKGGSRHE